MARQWKVGDVAMVEVGCQANRHVGMFTGTGWTYADKWAADDPAIVTARPLVVIDPEDREQVRGVLEAYGRQFTAWSPELDANVTKLQAALRSLLPADKPEEPTGRYAAVLDANNEEWLLGRDGYWWQVTSGFVKVDYKRRAYVDIDAVKVLSAGVEA